MFNMAADPTSDPTDGSAENSEPGLHPHIAGGGLAGRVHYG